jgi:ABC-type polysaccharide/polyol phosphate export permease
MNRPREQALPHVIYSAEGGHLTRYAGADLGRGLAAANLWSSLAIQDIAARYRGSILGPWWITLTMAALIGGMSLLYSRLMHLSLQAYVPWMSCGIVLWGFISSTVTEGCDTFTQAAPIIRQTSLPLFIFVLRTVARNTIVLAHNAIIIGVIAVLFGFWRSVQPLGLLLGLGLVLLNLSWIVLVAAVASARFRDVPQIFIAVMQVALFITPVFWRPDQLPNRPAILTFNPFYHLIEAVRAPLVGAAPPSQAFEVCAGLAAAGWALAFWVFALNRRRLVHYL